MTLFTTRLVILSHAGAEAGEGFKKQNKTKKDPDFQNCIFHHLTPSFPRNWDFSMIFTSIVQECL